MAPPAPTVDGELDDGSPNSKAARKKKTPVAVKDDKYADLLYPKPAPNLYRPIFIAQSSPQTCAIFFCHAPVPKPHPHRFPPAPISFHCQLSTGAPCQPRCLSLPRCPLWGLLDTCSCIGPAHRGSCRISHVLTPHLASLPPGTKTPGRYWEKRKKNTEAARRSREKKKGMETPPVGQNPRATAFRQVIAIGGSECGGVERR